MIPALRRLRQEDCYEFLVSLAYISKQQNVKHRDHHNKRLNVTR